MISVEQRSKQPSPQETTEYSGCTVTFLLCEASEPREVFGLIFVILKKKIAQITDVPRVFSTHHTKMWISITHRESEAMEV